MAVAIAMVVALLIVVDVSCYFINACGLTMCVCVHLCGHESSAAAAKPTSDKDVDDPERYDSGLGGCWGVVESLIPISRTQDTLAVDKVASEQLTTQNGRQ